MRGLLAVIMAAGAVAFGAALIDFALFVNHPKVGPPVSLWTCVRIGGTRQIGCLAD